MSEPEKEVTIYDIAKKLNISAATVSRGLKRPSRNKQKYKEKNINSRQRNGLPLQLVCKRPP